MTYIPTYVEHERAGELMGGSWESVVRYVHAAERSKRALEQVRRVIAATLDPANQPMMPPVNSYAEGHRAGMQFAYQDVLDTLNYLLTEESDPG